MGLLARLGLPPPDQGLAPVLGKRESREFEYDPDFRFPVTIAGQTRKMIVERIGGGRESIEFALGDVGQRLRAVKAAEGALAPLAAAVEKAMKTPVAKLAAEIRANADAKMRSMGRDAVNARAVLGLTDEMQGLLDELLKNARRQLELARKSLDAQNKIEQAAELRRQAAEIAAAFDLITGLFDMAKDFDVSDATLAGAGLSLATWGLKAIAGVDRLNEQAAKLEETAKALQVQVVREGFESAAQHAKALAKRVRPLLLKFQENSESYNQQRGEVEKLYDARSKGGFRFVAFEKALHAGEKVLAALEAAAEEARHAERVVASLSDWLGGMLKVEGKCASHHDKRESRPFEPDPRRVYEETTAMKAEMREALTALAPLRKRAETQTLGIRMQTGDSLERQQRWLAYYGAAQTALFRAPEPEPAR